MKARAIMAGYYGGKIVYPGETFEVEDGKTGSWFEPVDQATKKPAAKRQSPTEPDAKELI